MGKSIKSVSLTVDIPLVLSLPLTPRDAGNWIPSVFWEYPKTDVDILNENNPERKPFKIKTTDRFIRQSIVRNVKGMLKDYGISIKYASDSEPIIPPQEAIKSKIILIPNKDSDLYTMDTVHGIMMQQFKRFDHLEHAAYEYACMEYMRTSAYNSICREAPLTFAKYLCGAPLPTPMKVRIPYIPAGTVIHFNHPMSVKDEYDGIIEQAERIKQSVNQNIVFTE